MNYPPIKCPPGTVLDYSSGLLGLFGVRSSADDLHSSCVVARMLPYAGGPAAASVWKSWLKHPMWNVFWDLVP